MDIIEWIVMQILNVLYLEVHSNCRVENIRLTRTHKKDQNKYVDFMIKYKENIIILELNNNHIGDTRRNIVYAMTEIVNYYKRDSSNKNNYYKEKLKTYLINLNWYPKEKKNKELIKDKRIKEILSLDN